MLFSPVNESVYQLINLRAFLIFTAQAIFKVTALRDLHQSAALINCPVC